MAKVVVLGSLPESLINFRGPLLADMVAAGHEVHALAPGATPQVITALAGLGVQYHDVFLARTGLNPFRDLLSLLKLRALLRRLRPEYLLSYTIKPVVYGSLAARIVGVPNIYSMVTGLGYTFTASTLKSRSVGRVVKQLYACALACNRHVFFQNRDNLKVFEEAGLLGFQDQAVLINGSGVDLGHYAPAPLPQNMSFLMIARLLRDKGLYEYVAAARRIKALHPKVKFRLAGWIDDNPAAIPKEQLDAWVGEGVVDYLGYVTDIRPAMRDASVYVLPSYHEGMPRTVLEAMAMGRPIITTDVPGCRETVVEGSNGFLVPAKDVGQLVHAMSRFIDKPALLATMGSASRRLAEARFDVREVNRLILDTMRL
jgi:glycosyltransferase involved in cell wall biosynthesis